MDVRKNIALKLKDSAPSGNGTAAKPSERKEKKAKRKKEANKPSDSRGSFELESTSRNSNSGLQFSLHAVTPLVRCIVVCISVWLGGKQFKIPLWHSTIFARVLVLG